MRKYDQGNDWNRDSDSWVQSVGQKLACVGCLLLIVGYIIACFIVF